MNMALSAPRARQATDSEFLSDVIAGLQREQKSLPCKYLYDEAGSKIFERICGLSDYYLTRTERQLFARHLGDMASCIGRNAVLIEPGAGNCEKAMPLLAALDAPCAYIPMDISPEILFSARERITEKLPGLEVKVVEGDFSQGNLWDQLKPVPEGKRVIFFPGSTIGNFDPQLAESLLRSFLSGLRSGDGLLIAADQVKDSVLLERAYHDGEHVTEAFNKNLLSRINRELDGTFDLGLFAHRAFYHPLHQRVEMHLVSLAAQQVTVSGQKFRFREGETIHTENSHKYTLNSFLSMLRSTGYTPVKHWLDKEYPYAIFYAEVV